MKILMVHNYYQQRGGEDESTEEEIRLLKARDHEVLLFCRHNNEINMFSSFRKGLLFFEPTWSPRSFRRLRYILREFDADIVHVQNFFPLQSPSIYYACASMGTPVVQSLRNYRLLCPSATLFRRGNVCEECSTRSLWQGIAHGCYRHSRIQTASVALMIWLHRTLRTWRYWVDSFVTLSNFAKEKLTRAGVPRSKIFVRPNFLACDVSLGNLRREGALFIGRLSPEKGVHSLVEAWRSVSFVPLKIAGEGPERLSVNQFLQGSRLRNVEMLGFIPSREILKYLKAASFLVMPSTCYETFGRTIIEAYATGTPVIASRLGAIAEIVEDGKTGILFTPGDPKDLAAKVQWAWTHQEEMQQMGRQAREIYEKRYTADTAYDLLMDIYKKAIDGKKKAKFTSHE
jgi:glycosyltransferase involved in cell wall biosynthesis